MVSLFPNCCRSRVEKFYLSETKKVYNKLITYYFLIRIEIKIRYCYFLKRSVVACGTWKIFVLSASALKK